jgi:hypothetical protein
MEEDQIRPKGGKMASFELERTTITTKKTVFRVFIP